VTLEARVTDIGTLELNAVPVGGSERWKVEFDVRAETSAEVCRVRPLTAWLRKPLADWLAGFLFWTRLTQKRVQAGRLLLHPGPCCILVGVSSAGVCGCLSARVQGMSPKPASGRSDLKTETSGQISLWPRHRKHQSLFF
jgi:hypothetical protein